MASKLLTQSHHPTINVTISENNNIEPSNLFGYISFPKKKDQFSSYSIHSRDVSNSFQLPDTVTTTAGAATSITTTKCTSLANIWREIQGSNDWENLLNPLHPLLRDEIIRYGQFVNACYQAFDLDPSSRRFLNCKFGKKSMLQQVGLHNSGYRITKYIYATPDVNIPPIHSAASCGRWIGYVAVSNDEAAHRLGRRDILVAFRGTATNPEWVSNFMSSLTPARLDPHDPRPDVKVASGFLSLYTSDESHSKFGLGSCREQLLSEISRLLTKYRGEELSVTLSGHSMGSSLALLLGYDIAELGLNRPTLSEREIPVTVLSFGGPRVGNSGFKKRCEELGLKVLRIANVNDPITNLPGIFFNEKFGGLMELPWSYSHVGMELELDFFNVQNPSCVHDLETYIRLLKQPNKKRSSPAKRLQGRRISVDFMGRARELISGGQNLRNMLPWKDYATQ